MWWIKQPFAGEAWGEHGYVELDNGKHVSVEATDDTQVSGTSRGYRPMTVNWKSVRTLLLADDTLAYGCADCQFAAESPRSVFPHRNAHITPEERRARNAEKEAANARRAVRAVRKVTVESATKPVKAEPSRTSGPAQEKPRSVVQDVVPATNGNATGLSDAMDALRVVLAQAGSVSQLEREFAEAKARAEAAEARAEQAEAKVAEAKKLFG